MSVSPYAFAAASRLSAELSCSHVLAQVLVRRGLGEPEAARAFLAAGVRHGLEEWPGLAQVAERILDHVQRGSQITVHGDYDVDGVCSTAILVRALRTIGARVDWYLPSRIDDGYGLAAATVERLAGRGTNLLITVDCAVTAVEEVAAAKALGMDVIVTDHHSPRADGALPDAPIVHPRLNGYPCPELCAAGVAYKLAQALVAAIGEDPALCDEDLDLVALATVADVVPLQGENRRLVREGLKAIAGTRKVGLRALMEVARVDPSGLDESAIGFRLGPRLNAAGRLYRADAGLELLLTDDRERARAVAAELDAVNSERRDVETRIRFEAEALVAEHPAGNALVLAADGWHPGVIGIVASRIAERHHRPAVLIALEGDEGSGSGRSIPRFDLLGGLNASARHLLRHGGHKAAAGLTIHRDEVDAFRASFLAYANEMLTEEDLRPEVRIDAVAQGDALSLDLAEELQELAPFGMGNPGVSLLVPSAHLIDPEPMSEGRHVRFTLSAGGAKSRCVAFGNGGTLPVKPDEPADAAVRLEIDRWNGAVSPKLVLRRAQRCAPGAIDVVGEGEFHAGWRRELDRDLDAWSGAETRGGVARAHADLAAPAHVGGVRLTRDLRGTGIAGLLGDLVASGEPVLAVAAHAPARARALSERVGGFALTSWCALEDAPELAEPFVHVVAVDPPTRPTVHTGEGWTHLAWGTPELDFALRIHEWDFALRDPLTAVYRALRAGRASGGEAVEQLLRGEGPQPRSAALAGRLVRVLTELGLVNLDREGPGLEAAENPERTALERSAAYVAYQRRLEDGRRFLTSANMRRQAA
ncbi:single-stranded-DNA-specific exonuclease RecJ [Solirubrobacter phytolaccae]|uniref:Single-stranded-DNA-specific exonuclease RecJ n=1 Tax=Solirubrobacter phytolaccae TaxID=1404360 RepID=A0A9X3NJ46_9ACTN|nr:single-stranded-DNA-specific exonuclease RecJ [Solirubrobacter phytolaccae]MDA0182262.1 single-stranded-DNA-specific exonuclease RecJ [Solirubrobacter phytolaccae]